MPATPATTGNKSSSFRSLFCLWLYLASDLPVSTPNSKPSASRRFPFPPRSRSWLAQAELPLPGSGPVEGRASHPQPWGQGSPCFPHAAASAKSLHQSICNKLFHRQVTICTCHIWQLKLTFSVSLKSLILFLGLLCHLLYVDNYKLTYYLLHFFHNWYYFSCGYLK